MTHNYEDVKFNQKDDFNQQNSQAVLGIHFLPEYDQFYYWAKTLQVNRSNFARDEDLVSCEPILPKSQITDEPIEFCKIEKQQTLSLTYMMETIDDTVDNITYEKEKESEPTLKVQV